MYNSWSTNEGIIVLLHLSTETKKIPFIKSQPLMLGVQAVKHKWDVTEIGSLGGKSSFHINNGQIQINNITVTCTSSITICT